LRIAFKFEISSCLPRLSLSAEDSEAIQSRHAAVVGVTYEDSTLSLLA